MSNRPINELVTDYFYLVDEDGNGIPGVAGTLIDNLFTRDPSGSPFTPTITDVGDGHYRVTFTPTIPGDWHWWTFYHDPYQAKSETYDIDPLSALTGRRVGELVTDFFRIVNADGNGITGLTSLLVSRLFTQSPHGTTFAVDLVEMGGGQYRVQFTPNAPGDWYWWTYHHDPYQEKDAIYDIDPATPTLPPLFPTVQSSTGTTLMQLRRRLGSDLGDMVLLRATSNGETTRFNDEDRLLRPNYDGRVIYFPHGVNAGQQRRIPPKGGGAGYVTWGRPLSVPVQFGDEAELWNMNGIGFHPNMVNEHITNAHARGLEYAQIPIVDDGAYAQDSGPIEISPYFREIHGLQWSDRRGEWKTIPRAPRPGAPGYWVNRATRQIEIDGHFRGYMDLRSYRILGSGRENPIIYDSDQTVLDPEWIVAEAGRTLLMANLYETNDSRFLQQKLSEYSRESEMKRSRVRGRRAPNVDRV